MPAKSQSQRGYLAEHFGPEWMKEHHFDNKGKLPEHFRHYGSGGEVEIGTTGKVSEGLNHQVKNMDPGIAINPDGLQSVMGEIEQARREGRLNIDDTGRYHILPQRFQHYGGGGMVSPTGGTLSGLNLSAQPQGSARGQPPNSTAYYQPGAVYDPYQGPFLTNSQGNLQVASTGYTNAIPPPPPDYGNNSGYVTSDPSGAGLAPSTLGPDPFAGSAAGGSSGTIIDPFAGATAGGSAGSPGAGTSGGLMTGGGGGAAGGSTGGPIAGPGGGGGTLGGGAAAASNQVPLTPNSPFSGGGTGSGFGGVGPQFQGGGGGFATQGDAQGSALGAATGGYLPLSGGGGGSMGLRFAARSKGGIVPGMPQHFQAGGLAGDSVPSMLAPGEVVLNQDQQAQVTPHPDLRPDIRGKINQAVMAHHLRKRMAR